MPGSKRLIVGLGNPGEEYEGTRHNVGFGVVKALADRTGVSLSAGPCRALEGWGNYRGFRFGLALPLTYVNRSGEAVQSLLNRHGLSSDELLVVVDDLHLPTGTIRLRPAGGAGGHNGLDHIVRVLGTTDFPRLRIGIGNDFPRGEQVDYVLSPFSEEQQPLVDEAVERACEAALVFVHDGIEPAMNRYN